MSKEPYIIVISNDGKKKKYVLFRRNLEIASAEITFEGGDAHCTVYAKDKLIIENENFGQTNELLRTVIDVLISSKLIASKDVITAAALAITAPSGYFLQDRILGQYEIDLLESLATTVAGMSISAILYEIRQVKQILPTATLVGVSDSQFHVTKPDYAWNYGIQLDDADAFDIKRFGFDGLVVESVVKQLKLSRFADRSKVIVCHLGGVTNVTAIYNGKSVDTTTGFTPNEGCIMLNQSGTVDFIAGLALAKHKQISAEELAHQLVKSTGISGIVGDQVEDISQVIKSNKEGSHRAGLAMSMYIYRVRQAIAAMSASLEGVDALVFTGIYAQNEPELIKRIVAGLSYLGIVQSSTISARIRGKTTIQNLHPRTRSKPLLLIADAKERTVASHARKMLI